MEIWIQCVDARIPGSVGFFLGGGVMRFKFIDRYVQSYPQWMSLQRRLYGIFTVFFSFIHDTLQL